jgi:hypothetical protein
MYKLHLINILCALSFSFQAKAQFVSLPSGNVGIGTVTPSHQLHTTGSVRFQTLTGTNSRLLQTDAIGILAPVAGGATGQVLTQGATGLTWTTPIAASANWSLTGNAAPTGSFLGTTNTTPLQFKVNNVKAGLLSTNNTFLGYQAGLINTTGYSNAANGVNALAYNTTGNNNTATGSSALIYNDKGSYNTATGANASLGNVSGNYNTADGASALLNNYAGNFNTAMGVSTLATNKTGSYNTALGTNADVTSIALNNATAIGYNAKVSVNNGLVLGQNGTVLVGIGTSSPTSRLEVNSGVPGTSGIKMTHLTSAVTPTVANGKALSVDGVGNIILVPVSTSAPTNIYNADGTLLTNRVVTMGGKNLTFNPTTATAPFFVNGTSGNVGIGTVTPLQPLHTNGGVRHNSLAGTGNGLIMANNLGDLARVAAGTAGQVLTQTAAGVAWGNGSVDNLGNHSATTALNMNCFNLQKVGGLQFCPPTLANVYLGTDALGNVIPKVGVGDNLGNHTATLNLNMSCKGIDKAQSIQFCNTAGLTDVAAGASAIPELLTKNPLGIGMNMPVPILGGVHMLAVKGSAYVEGDPGSIGIYGNINGSRAIPELPCTPQYTRPLKFNQIGTSTKSEFHIGTSGEAYDGYTGMGVFGYSENNQEAIGVYGMSNKGKYGYGVYGHIGENDKSYAIYGDASPTCSKEGATSSGAWAGYFNGDVFIAGTYGPSDRRLKTNINPMTNALSKIKQLHLTTYNYDTEKYKQMMLPKGLRFGVIADELEKVFPTMVKQTVHPAKYDSKGAVVTEAVEFKAVNYTELIPVALEGIKEQQAIIEEQQATITSLKDRLDRLEAALNKLTGVPNNELAVQNDVIKLAHAPNPVSDKTIIAYELPKNRGNAQIIITDLLGKSIKTIQLHDYSGQIEILAQDLPNGTFVYSLIVNGKILKTNKMVISNP